MSELKPCSACGGPGRRMYPNTATWHRDTQIAGQAFSFDICDKCWGSGDEERPFLNLYEWGNRRAPSPAVDALVEAACELLTWVSDNANANPTLPGWGAKARKCQAALAAVEAERGKK